MKNLDELKEKWLLEAVQPLSTEPINKDAWENIIEAQVKKQRGISFQYFWASLAYQIIVYGFLTYTLLIYGKDTLVLLPGVVCFLLFIPFSLMLLLKFKQMAIGREGGKVVMDNAIKDYIEKQYTLLNSYYKFKTRYEIFLVPITSAVFVWIFFQLYIPGGVMAYPIISGALFLFILIACTAAIVAENKRNFKKPLGKLSQILNDLNSKNKSNI